MENKTFLLVTANKHESAALLDDRSFVYHMERSPDEHDDAFYNVGKFGHYNAVHFELNSQGSIGADSAQLAIASAINSFHPDAVILLGIAFGKEFHDTTRPTQRIGDVLISTKVADYESGKVKEGRMLSDGFVAESGRQLLSTLKHYSKSWKHLINGEQANCEFGTILSGDKVVDDRVFKEKLMKCYPRAIGGEMEGRGAYSACRSRGIQEWIIVKAICDWADGTKGREKEKNQRIAADSAVSFLNHVFTATQSFDKVPKLKNSFLSKENYWSSGVALGTDDPLPLSPVQPFLRRKIKCFISYSHKDSRICSKFKTHLQVLNRQYEIEAWYDGLIPAGKEIDEEISKHLEDSDIVFLLITQNYIASNYCYEREMQKAITRHSEGKCLVVPVICRNFISGSYPFSKLKYVPVDGKPVDQFKTQNDGFVNALTSIRNLLEEFFFEVKDSRKLNNKNASNRRAVLKADKNRQIQTTNNSALKYPVIKNRKERAEPISQEVFDKVILNGSSLPLFVSIINETTQQQLKSFTAIRFPKTPTDAFWAYCRSNLEIYLLQIMTYIQSYFTGIENTCVHFRYKNEHDYYSLVDVGYPVSQLPKTPISALGGMIEYAANLDMPVIKSYNIKLHERTHPLEKIKRDYITFSFNRISSQYQVDLSMCISIIGKNNNREMLIPLALLQINKHIENFLLQYFADCSKINPHYDLLRVLNSKS